MGNYQAGGRWLLFPKWYRLKVSLWMGIGSRAKTKMQMEKFG